MTQKPSLTQSQLKKQLLFIILILIYSFSLQAQVTIGAGTAPQKYSILEISTQTLKGGIRLPHLTASQRDDLNKPSGTHTIIGEEHRGDVATSIAPGLALGLTIYNTDTNCIEYWDGYKWVSLCLGSASIDLGNYPQPPLPPEGGETGSMIPDEKPKCAENPPYSIAVSVGAAYSNAYIVEQSTGEFRVYMQPNNTAKSRTAIIKLTNNCTGEYKEFLFSQDGNAGLCNNLGTRPILTASNNGVICGTMGNSIILAVTNPVATATYIWMRNDNEEIGRGKFITVSQGGNYKVYAGGIGCTGNDESDAISVTVNPSGTPSDTPAIMADNGAVVCGGVAVTLTVRDFSLITGTVEWYKDGLLAGTGQSITTTSAGVFMAVLSDGGGCSSSPSNNIVVEEKAGTAVAFSKSDIEINGKALNLGDPMFCSGGWLNMRITNVQTGYVYKWIVNGTQVGSGSTCNYQLPGGAGSDVNLSIIAESGAANTCPAAITISSTMSANEPLNASITGAKIFCNNVPGGAQLNAASGGTSYLWKNLTTGLTYNTGSTNSFGATSSGRYEVQITTSAGCLSVTPSPHEVEMLGSPALTWTGGVLASIVGEGETVTFVVKNVGSPVTQGYTWTATPKSGSANATIPAGTTVETAQISFTGGGVVTLSITAKGNCGNSAPLLVDVTVNQNKPDAPVLDDTSPSPVCGGWLFKVKEGDASTPGTIKYYEAQYGTDFTIIWNEVTGAGNTIGTGPKIVSGAYGQYCYVPFTLVGGCIATMKASCISQGLVSDPSVPKIAFGGTGEPQTYALSGQTCFDVKQTNWPGTDCGVWAHRTEADFNIWSEYELTGTLLPSTTASVTWSLTDPNNLVENTNFTNLNKALIKIKDLRLDPLVKGSKTGLSFTLHVSFTVVNNGCTATYSKSIDVNIRDCDCCGSVVDVDGNVYKAHRFNDAGCWMIENLAVTKRPDNATITYTVPGGAINATKTKPVANGGLSYGLHYTWNVAMNGQTFEGITGAGTTKSTVQGICPAGWVLPSDYDWSMLEQEIATNPTPYSSNTKVWVWNIAWQSATGWRPNSNNPVGAWGESMKSSRIVPGLTNANGRSNNNGTGFDLLITGYSGSTNSEIANHWTSSSYGSDAAWVRTWYADQSGVGRTNITKSNIFSVRCKKRD